MATKQETERDLQKALEENTKLLEDFTDLTNEAEIWKAKAQELEKWKKDQEAKILALEQNEFDAILAKQQATEQAELRRAELAEQGIIIPQWVNKDYTVRPQYVIGRVREYKVKPGEENTVHAEVEQMQFSSLGRKKTRPYVIKVDPVMWKRIFKNLPGQGFNYICTLHVPKGVEHVFIEPEETQLDPLANLHSLESK